MEKIKYYFTADEQRMLAETAHPYENNTDEFELVRKYVRKYPPHCKQKESRTTKHIALWIQKYATDMIIERKTIKHVTKAMGRRGFVPQKKHEGNMYECYLLSQEQADYIAKYRNQAERLDESYDYEVPRELVLAGHRASEENMLLAKQCLDEANGDFKTAEKAYRQAISLYGNYSTKGDELPF